MKRFRLEVAFLDEDAERALFDIDKLKDAVLFAELIFDWTVDFIIVKDMGVSKAKYWIDKKGIKKVNFKI